MNKQFYNTMINTTGGSCCCCCCICNISTISPLSMCASTFFTLLPGGGFLFIFIIFNYYYSSALAHISGFFFVHFSDGYDHFFLWLVSRVFLVRVLARKISGVQSILYPARPALLLMLWGGAEFWRIFPITISTYICIFAQMNLCTTPPVCWCANITHRSI